MKIAFSTKNVRRASFLDTCRIAYDYGFRGFEIYDAPSERISHHDSILRRDQNADAKRKLVNRNLSVCALRLPSPLPSPVRKIDRVSFSIYLWHCLVITLFNYYAPQLGLTRVSAQFIARLFVTYGVTIGGCLLWQKLVRGALRKK